MLCSGPQLQLITVLHSGIRSLGYQNTQRERELLTKPAYIRQHSKSLTPLDLEGLRWLITLSVSTFILESLVGPLSGSTNESGSLISRPSSRLVLQPHVRSMRFPVPTLKKKVPIEGTDGWFLALTLTIPAVRECRKRGRQMICLRRKQCVVIPLTRATFWLLGSMTGYCVASSPLTV